MCHRQVDIGDPLLARYVREVEGEDEVDVVGSPAHQEFYNYYCLPLLRPELHLQGGVGPDEPLFELGGKKD